MIFTCHLPILQSNMFCKKAKNMFVFLYVWLVRLCLCNLCYASVQIHCKISSYLHHLKTVIGFCLHLLLTVTNRCPFFFFFSFGNMTFEPSHLGNGAGQNEICCTPCVNSFVVTPPNQTLECPTKVPYKHP